MISTNATLVELSLSIWTARKMDKKVSEEIDASKSTKTRAGNYHKNLMAGSATLERIRSLAGAVRTWHYENTLPWADAGSRLLPMKNFFEYKTKLGQYEQEFEQAVSDFLSEYDVLVSAAAFKLGALFDRSEYPSRDEVRAKFRFSYVFAPVPEVGDFRVDVEAETKRLLEDQYKSYYQNKLEDAMKDAWQRLYDTLTHISERLDYTPENKKRFWDTTITNAAELCPLLTRLNVTNDPKLEQARQQLEQALTGVDAASIRESDELRNTVKNRVDEILSMF